MKVTNLIVFVSIDNLHFERFCIEPAHFLCEWPIGIMRIVEADVDEGGTVFLWIMWICLQMLHFLPPLVQLKQMHGLESEFDLLEGKWQEAARSNWKRCFVKVDRPCFLCCLAVKAHSSPLIASCCPYPSNRITQKIFMQIWLRCLNLISLIFVDIFVYLSSRLQNWDNKLIMRALRDGGVRRLEELRQWSAVSEGCGMSWWSTRWHAATKHEGKRNERK